MKIKLDVTNVGGLIGKNTFEFDSEKINIIESPNSGGKSSVIKAITSVLSIPRNGNFDKYILSEAFTLGIKTDPRNPREGYVNLHAELGSVELSYNDKKDKYAVSKFGEYIELPNSSDQRFLLTGILSNESRVIRQLNGLEDYEPDDFKWAVTQLSNAKGYDQVTEVFKTHQENFEDKLMIINRDIKNLNNLRDKKTELEKEKEELIKKLDELRPLFSSSNDLMTERIKLSNEIAELNKRMSEKETDINKVMRTGVDKYDRDLKEKQKKKTQLDDKIESIDLKKIEEEIKREGPELDQIIKDKINIRNETNVQLNLFLTAKSNVKTKNEDILCPLCNNGKINAEYVTVKINELQNNKINHDEEIATLSNKKYNMSHNHTKKKNEHTDLINKRSNILSDISNIERAIKLPNKQIKSLRSMIDGYKNRLKTKNQELTIISNLIGKSDEEINSEYTKMESRNLEITEVIGRLNQQIDQISNIVLLDENYDIENALPKVKELILYIKENIKFSNEKAERERQEAARQFNDSIKTLMSELNFSNFRNVALNRDYRLFIERFNPDTEDYVSQQAQTLSTSEKLTIALVLQLALKETYLPTIPFFVIDDIMEDFDEDRREKIMSYLKNKSAQEEFVIIMTKLVENIDQINIRQISR